MFFTSYFISNFLPVQQERRLQEIGKEEGTYSAIDDMLVSCIVVYVYRYAS